MAIDLLHDLLARLANGGIYTLAQLAGELRLDQGLLEQMLSDLERAGYVRLATSCCSSECAHCASREHCQSAPARRIWTVTPRGLRAIDATRCSARSIPGTP
jgi:hypothetical protein